MKTTDFKKIRALRNEGQFTEAIRKIDTILSELDPSAYQRRAELLNEKTRCYRYQRNYEAAEKSALEAINSASQPPPALKELGWASAELGIILSFGMLRNKEAEKALTQAKDLFSEIKDNRGLAYALSYLGVLYYFLGEPDKAKRFSKQGMQLIENLDDINEIAEVKIIRAVVCMLYTGEQSQAKALFQESLALCEPLAYRGNFAWALYNLGILYSLQDEKSKAEPLYRESLGIMEEDAQVGVRVVHQRYVLILALLAQNSLDEAEAEIEKYNDLIVRPQSPRMKTLVWGRYNLAFGRLKLLKHDLGSALEYGFKAKQVTSEIGSLQIEVLRFLIQAHLQLYLSTQQEESKRKILAFMEEIEELSQQPTFFYIDAKIAQGFLKRANFDLKGANEEFQLAETLAKRYGFEELAKIAHEEIIRLRSQTATLQQLIAHSPEQYETMQMQEMLSYLEGAQRIIEKEGP